MSNPGSLSHKNLSDIENNIIDGKTSWKHQNDYARIMIAGCMNQAARIIEKYDKVLFGPAPEEQIQGAHKKIRELLVSQEAMTFNMEATDSSPEAVARCDTFVKKLIEAIPPIIPITQRNKSLNGAYMRTGLHFLGAAELMFSRYENDIRREANPAGVVGLCNAMHTSFSQCALANNELKPKEVFIREMSTQYQTSLGMGFGFPNDSVARKASRRTFGRGKTYSRSDSQVGRGLSRQQHRFQEAASASPIGRGGLNRQAARLARGACRSFLAGACWRGESCKFSHSSA